MGTKLRKFSYSRTTKTIAFIVAILCFSGAITLFLNTMDSLQNDVEIAFIDNYYLGNAYMGETEQIVSILTNIAQKYKNEGYILEGGTLTDDKIEQEKRNLFAQFEQESIYYNSDLSQEENYKKFEKVYEDKILKIEDQLIQQDLKAYNGLVRRLKDYKGIDYYVSDGTNDFTNNIELKEDYTSYPSYIVSDKSGDAIYPKLIKENRYYHRISSRILVMKTQKGAMYLGFTDEFLKDRIAAWNKNKVLVTNNLYKIAGFMLGLLLTLVYLILVIGRKDFKDKEVHLNFIDRLYTDINTVLCLGLIGSWFVAMQFIYHNDIESFIFSVTFSIGTVGLLLVLSLVKHLKNKTLIRHTLIYSVSYKSFKLLRTIYDSGSVGVKVASVVVIYPLIIIATIFLFRTFFILPIIVGIAVWFALKKTKEFNAIKEGVAMVKGGNLHHKIEVEGKGELGNLASNINSITDGLNKAVDNEVKSQRLKTELISNVSHDIRTPLTSIITYVDLLKHEKEPSKIDEYIKILEQKSQRLKTLTEDLFEASKATSGSIPVNYEKIDIVSLLTQGLGELDDKVQASKLSFKISHCEEKIIVKADGKLLWRAMENLLSNIFKYALSNSRVYIDIDSLEDSVCVTMKNISAYELNISSDELMERFKRGDESRNSQGSGLGLSIAKSLIELQGGSFDIEIDGDLFKAVVIMSKWK